MCLIQRIRTCRPLISCMNLSLCQVAGQNNQLVHEPSSSSGAKGRASTETSKHTSCVVSDGHHDSKSPSALRVSRILLSPQSVLLVSSLRNPSARNVRARSAARCGDDSVHPRVSPATGCSRIVSCQFPPQMSNCKPMGFFRQHRAHKPDQYISVDRRRSPAWLQRHLPETIMPISAGK